LTIVCFPLGGTLAALLSAQVLPLHGWRTLFIVGGIIPIVLAIVLYPLLPESPKYLATRPDRWSELIRMLRRLGHDVPGDATFVETGTEGGARAHARVRDLFVSSFRMDTLGLFGAFFFGLMANNVGILYIPVMLTTAGFTQAVASNALAAWNFGGVAGAILGAWIIQRLGSRITQLTLAGAGVASALVMATMSLDPDDTFLLIVMFVLLGGTLNAVITTTYALAANVYPTEIRGTGIGTAVAMGRLGMVLASYVGNFALDAGGAPAYFSSFAVTITIVLGSLAIVRRHIEPSKTGMTRAPARAATGR
jgi:AAHS family 4-hydroxybenzoate transporter-like MFS transporter